MRDEVPFVPDSRDGMSEQEKNLQLARELSTTFVDDPVAIVRRATRGTAAGWEFVIQGGDGQE